MPRFVPIVLLCTVALASCAVSVSNEEAKAAFKLAYDYQHGINVEASWDKAAMQYKKAAEGGIAEAQFIYGNLLVSGRA
jgi:TPR repeat protein